MKTADGVDDEEALMPIIVMFDCHTGYVAANLVPKKGAIEFTIKRMIQDLDILGYKKLILKSDQEPAIIALKQAIKRERYTDREKHRQR